MDQATNKAKEVDQSQTDQKREKAEPKPSDAQTAQKGEKAELKPSDAKKLIEFMEDNYDQYVANVQSFDEFYHAIFELIEMFCEERGQVQYKIPEKEKLLEAYQKHHTAGGELKREEFIKIGKEVFRPGSFAIGKATIDFLMLLFGAPFCALAAKRILPGLGWLSDDVVIPLATSGSVVYLVKTKKL